MTRIKDDSRIYKRLNPVTEWVEPKVDPVKKEKPVAKKAAPKAAVKRKASGSKRPKA